MKKIRTISTKHTEKRGRKKKRKTEKKQGRRKTVLRDFGSSHMRRTLPYLKFPDRTNSTSQLLPPDVTESEKRVREREGERERERE